MKQRSSVLLGLAGLFLLRLFVFFGFSLFDVIAPQASFADEQTEQVRAEDPAVIEIDSQPSKGMLESGGGAAIEADYEERTPETPEVAKEEATEDTAEAIQEPPADPSVNVNVKIQDEVLEPTNITILPGTTVVWINNAQNPVIVRFLSKAVSTTCQAPRGFVLGDKGIFVSENIVGGGVASLCFLERREYEYEVEFVDQDEESATKLAKLAGIVKVK